MTNPKTKQHVTKHNDKSDKPEEVGIVWDSAIGLGLLTDDWTGHLSINIYRKNQPKNSSVVVESSEMVLK